MLRALVPRPTIEEFREDIENPFIPKGPKLASSRERLSLSALRAFLRAVFDGF
jgi:hypothetical protein